MMDLFLLYFLTFFVACVFTSPTTTNHDSSLLKRSVSIFLPSDLPTISAQQDCIEVLSNGAAVGHVKTGSICTYNTIRPTPTPSAPSAPSAPSKTEPQCLVWASPVNHECDLSKNPYCTLQDVKQDLSRQDCEGFCGTQAANDKDKFNNAECLAFGNPLAWQYFSGNDYFTPGKCLCNNTLIDWFVEQFVEHALPAVGEVTCKVFYTAISSVIQIGLDAIPGLGEIESAGLSFAIMASQAIAFSIENEKDAHGVFSQFLNDPSNAQTIANNTAHQDTSLMDKLCGNKYTPPEAEKVFNIFQDVANVVSIAKIFASAKASAFWPPPWAKGTMTADNGSKNLRNYLEDLLNGKPKPRPVTWDHPVIGPPRKGPTGPKTPLVSILKGSPKETDPPKPTKKMTSDKPHSTTSAPKCSSRIRKRVGKGKEPADGDEKRGTQITSYLIDELVQADEIKTVVKQCELNSPQACYHYYSAIKHGGRDDKFTCSASHAGGERVTLKKWYGEHKDDTWRAFTKQEYAFANKGKPAKMIRPKCHADEWPPAYFLHSDKNELSKPQWGQLIRYLPGSENTAAGQLWKSFCSKHDGDEGNGLRDSPLGGKKAKNVNPLTLAFNVKNEKKGLFKREDKQKPSSHVEGECDDITTVWTHRWKKATFTRAVFSLEFKKYEKANLIPKPENFFYLDQNPCWPQDIVQDPGYVLLEGDPWYKNKDLRYGEFKDIKAPNGIYAKPPPQKVLAAAMKKRPDVIVPVPKGKKKPDSEQPAGEQSEDQHKGKQSKKPPPTKRLELQDDRLLILRDDIFNSSRPLTPEELRQNVEFINCEDRDCSQERKELNQDDEDVVFIRGAGPPMTPSMNIAIPTMATSVRTSEAAIKRTPLLVDLPLVTPVAKRFH